MILRLTVLVVFLGSFARCDSEQMNKEQRQAEADLVQICSKLTIPNAAKLSERPITRGWQKVVILREFRSDMSCEQIRDHFVDYFSSLQWDRDRMKNYVIAGGGGGDTSEFRDREYLVLVQCNKSSQAPYLGTEVGVSCSWGLR